MRTIMLIRTLARKILGDKALGMIDYHRFPEFKESWGGPFNGQKFRQQMFLELIQKVGFSAIVETGTFHGTTTDYLHRSSRLPVYTIELNARYYGYAKLRFLMHDKVVVALGDSRDLLRKLSGNPSFSHEQVFCYLDAHWSEDLPLKEEVQIIFENWPRATVMIDDFQVPGDKDYGFDDYGEDKVLSLEYLNQPDLAAFFPSNRGELETGARRGCVVLAKANDLIEKLTKFDTLVLYAGNDSRSKTLQRTG